MWDALINIESLTPEELQKEIDQLKLQIKWSAEETGFMREQMLNVYAALIRRQVMVENNLI